MIKGVTVVLHERTLNGTDEIGSPIYKTTDTSVKDVLWSPSTVDDNISQTRLEGTKELYTLCIPKGNTNTWLENTVTFNGKTFHCYAETEYIEENVPLRWNKKVLVERYDG